MTAQQPRIQSLGRFPVSTVRARLEAFRAATGFTGDGEVVPATFPVTWIAEPDLAEILHVLYHTIGAGKAIVLQTEQSFDYAHPLQPDTAYGMHIAVDGPDTAGFYRLIADISDAEDHHILKMTSTFVFVTLPQENT